MKLVIRQYLESLRERDELDALLPSLLSELGGVVKAIWPPFVRRAIERG